MKINFYKANCRTRNIIVLSTILILELYSFLSFSQTNPKPKVIMPAGVYQDMKANGQLKEEFEYVPIQSENTSSQIQVTENSFNEINPDSNEKIGEKAANSCNCLVPIDATFSIAEFTSGTAPNYRNDDGSTPVKALPFTFCMYGTNYNSFYINNNGNISFGAGYATFTSTGFPSTAVVMVAPFWADVDTRGAASGLVYYKITPTYAIVQWKQVGYYNSHTDKLNTFQLIITNGADPIVANGNNVAFCYGSMQWTTGDVSPVGNVGGFGGTASTVGVNKGDGVNFAQIGRFNIASAAFNGPTTASGVYWLNNKSFYLNTCTATNIPPIVSGLNNCDTIRVCGYNDSILLNANFLSPEAGQITTVSVNLNGTAGATVISNVAGNVSTTQVQIVASVLNAGNNIITFTATDNGTPAQTTVVNTTVFVDTTGLANNNIVMNGTLALCQGNPTTLSVTPTTANSYLWNTGAITTSINVTTPGNYWVTSTLNGCSKTIAVNIPKTLAATFSYTGSPFCQNATNPAPIFVANSGAGTFTAAPAGLSINAATGVINLAGSTPGTYTVTNTIAAALGCPAVSATASVTITAAPVATFSYTGTPYCSSAANPSPTYSGGGIAGTFTSSPAGLSINAATGAVNIAASTPGSYTVTNTIAATGGCAVVVATSPITIVAPAVATFSYTGTPYCQNAANPSPTFSGGGVAGTFSSTAGLVFISNTTGQVDLINSTPGTYTVTNTLAAVSPCPAITATATITISAIHVGNFIYVGDPFCQNAANPSPTFIGGGTAGTFSAAAGLSLNAVTGAVNLLATTPGTYTVYNSFPAANGCPIVKDSTTITVANSFGATFSYTGTPYCQNAANPSPTYAVGSVPGIFTATPAGLAINSSTGVVNLAASTAGTYTVKDSVPPSGACAGAVGTTTIRIIATPLATFSYTGNPYCINFGNAFPTFSGGGIAGVFSSTAGLVFINTATGQVDLVNSIPGTYTVTNTVAAGTCPPSIATATIVISPNLVATFSYTGSPYCQNSANPSPTFSGGGIAGTFTSTPGLSINVNTGVINVAVSAAGTYTVTNTLPATAGCPPVVATATITISPLPVATFSYTANPYCNNGTNPVPTFTGGGVAGTFSSTAGLVFLNTHTGVVDLVNSNPGTYTITNTIPAAAGCAAVIATASITIVPAPVATFSYTGSPYCQTSGTNPSPVFSGGGVAGTFSSTAGLTIDPTTGTITLASSTPGTYTVVNTIAASAGCAVVTAIFSITIDVPLTGNFGYVNSPYCQNGSNPVATIASGSVAGTFSSTAGLIFISTTTGQVDLTNSTPGTYTVTNSLPANACPAGSTTADITITAPPIATFSYAGSPYCTTGANPTPTFSGGGVAGTFSSSAGLTIDATTGTITLSSSTPGTYIVTNTIAATASCGAVTATFSITINGQQVSTFAYPATNYCQQGTASPVNVVTAGGTFSSTAGLSINAGTGDINLTSSTLGTYTVTYTTAGPCASASTNTVNILPVTVANTVGAATIDCHTGTVTLSGVGSSAGATFSYLWTGGHVVSGATTLTPVVDQAATYTLTVTNSVTNCTAIATVIVTGTIAPVASFSANPTSGTVPLTVSFTNSSTNATTYSWTFPGGTPTSSNQPSPTVTYTVTGNYTAYLVVSNGSACVSRDSATIDVYAGYTMVIPNAFSPNGDNINDLFVVTSTGVASIEGTIYDRWGVKIFSFTEPKEGWDGRTTAGVPCVDGTYYYVITSKGFDGSSHEDKGFISLFR